MHHGLATQSKSLYILLVNFFLRSRSGQATHAQACDLRRHRSVITMPTERQTPEQWHSLFARKVM